MRTEAKKTHKKPQQPLGNELSQLHDVSASTFQFTNSRPESLTQQNMQSMADKHTEQQLTPIQKKGKSDSSSKIIQLVKINKSTVSPKVLLTYKSLNPLIKAYITHTEDMPLFFQLSEDEQIHYFEVMNQSIPMLNNMILQQGSLKAIEGPKSSKKQESPDLNTLQNLFFQLNPDFMNESLKLFLNQPANFSFYNPQGIVSLQIDSLKALSEPSPMLMIEDKSTKKSEKHEDIPKKIHSIWVQGDYRTKDEAVEGMKTRDNEELKGWVNIMWLYNSGDVSGGFDESLLGENMDIHTQSFAPVLKKSFVHEMQAWKDRPKWVTKWLPILDILMQKKAYITMSDLMRMIILYYEGGMYLDVKIKVGIEKTMFKKRPMVYINRAHFYSMENWAIMANTGCKMIEDIMKQAYKQFPKKSLLRKMPENYQIKGQEGKTHVDLHENQGVWNVIDKIRSSENQKFPLKTLKLENPRPRNSWTESYEDREHHVIESEKQSQNQEKKIQLEKKKQKLETDLRLAEEAQTFINRGMEKFVRLTPQEIKELPTKISNLKFEIMKVEFELMDYE